MSKIHAAAVDDDPSVAVPPRKGATHARRSHAQPARAGVLLLNARLRPVHYNTEATKILGYPGEARRAPSLDDLVALAPEVADLLESGLPQAVELRSGRRRYVCRSFGLAPKGGTDTRLHPRFVIILEREPAADVDVERWSDEFQLTTREREAVGLLLKGLTSKQIAAHMRISPNTVKSFLKLVMIKVGATNRTGIVAKIFESAS